MLGKPRTGAGKQRQVILLREPDTVLSRAENAAVVPDVAEAKLVHQRRSKYVDVREHGLLGVVLRRSAAPDEPREITDGRLRILRDREAPVEIVLRGERLIDANIALIRVGETRGLVEEITGERAGSAEVRQRNLVRNRHGGRIEAALRNDIARERRGNHDAVRADLARVGIVDRNAGLREIAAAKVRRRNVADGTACRCGLARALIIGEEERLVVDDRSAHRASKLVLVERRFRQSGGVGEEVVRVEIVVAQELE